jgi:hypothetical protein
MKSHKSQLSIISKSKTNKSQARVITSPSMRPSKIKAGILYATPASTYKTLGNKVISQNKLLQKQRSKSNGKVKKVSVISRR